MRICLIASGVEAEDIFIRDLEISPIIGIFRKYFDEAIYGGSSVGIMSQLAKEFALQGGRVIGVAPPFLETANLLNNDIDIIPCKTLAERKEIMFCKINAVLCYPGGIGTYDELFDLLARISADEISPVPEIFIYNRDKFYSPLRLQLESSKELGLIKEKQLLTVYYFETVEGLANLLYSLYTI